MCICDQMCLFAGGYCTKSLTWDKTLSNKKKVRSIKRQYCLIFPFIIAWEKNLNIRNKIFKSSKYVNQEI